MSRQTGHHSRRRQSKANSQQSQRSKLLTSSVAVGRPTASPRPKNAGKTRTTERSKVSRAKANKKSKKLKHSGRSRQSKHSKHSRHSRHSKHSKQLKQSKHSKQTRFAESVVKMLSSSSDLNALELAKVKLPNLHVFQHEPEMKHVFDRFPIHVQAIAFLADYYARNLRLPAQQLQTQMPQLVIYLCTLLQSGSCSWQQVVSKLQRWFLIALEQPKLKQPKQPKKPNQLAGGGLGWLKKVLVGIGLVSGASASGASASGASASGASASGASFAQPSVNLTEALIDAKTKGFDSSDVLTPLDFALSGLRSVTHNDDAMISGVAAQYFEDLGGQTASRTEQLFVTPFAKTCEKLIAYGVSLGYLDPSSDLNSKSQHLESDEISKLMYIFNNITSANFDPPPSLSPHLSSIVLLYVDSVKTNMHSGLESIENVSKQIQPQLDKVSFKQNMADYKEDAASFASSVAVVMQKFMNTQTTAYIESNQNSMSTLTQQVLRNLFVRQPDATLNLHDTAYKLRNSVFDKGERDEFTTKATLEDMVEHISTYFKTPRVVDEFKASLSEVVKLYKNYESFKQNVSNFEPPFWTWPTTLVAVSTLMALIGGLDWKIRQIYGSKIWPEQFKDTNEDTNEDNKSLRERLQNALAAFEQLMTDKAAKVVRSQPMTGEAANLVWSQPMTLRSGLQVTSKTYS